MDLLEKVIRNRRTHKLFSGDATSRSDIERWLEIALQAPNHRRNEPWKLVVVDKESLIPFSQKILPLLDQVMPDKEPQEIERKKKKMSELYENSGALIFFLSQKDEKALVEKENYAAVCCAIQNFMLLTEKEGIGSFWSTGRLVRDEISSSVIGYDFSLWDMAGAIFIGKPKGTPQPPCFQLGPHLRYWTDSST